MNLLREKVKKSTFSRNKKYVRTYADYVMYSFTKDRLLSTRLVSNPKGEVAVAKDFGAYGEPIDVFTREDVVDNNVNKARYTGHVYDDIAGLYYAKARTYDPRDKRFTSLDPVMDGLNWYEYCRSNPLKYTDPTGNLVPAEAADLREKNKPKPEYHYYKPTYDFADYNSSEFMQFTNCYAYAFGMQVNPVTGEKFPVGGNQPGLLSNDEYYVNRYIRKLSGAREAFINRYYMGTEESNKNLVDVIRRDAEVVGLNFDKYNASDQRVAQGKGKRVALLVKKPIGSDLKGGDFHWYVEDEEQWKNKNGRAYATDRALKGFDTSGNLHYEKYKITDYKSAGALLGYEVVGEFYITRKDGKDFD